jgi:cell division protein FtsZ
MKEDIPQGDKDKPAPGKPRQKPGHKHEEKAPHDKAEEKPLKNEEPPQEERTYTFTLFEKKASSKEDTADEGEDGLFAEDEDEFGVGKEISTDQIINEEGMMEYRKTKERLEQQARVRREKLKTNKRSEMTKEEFNEKWTLPAYLRRGVKMDNVPHSSEPFISRYNLNDDNNLLGNNKFLHDNVD